MSSALPTAQELVRLLGAGVAAAGVEVGASEVGPLLPGEAEPLSRARPERLAEYRAGRHAARLALSALGEPAQPIARNADRSPRWPQGIVGSITHVRRDGLGWAAAAVGRDRETRSIGLDAESAAPLEAALFRRVLRPAEQAWVDRRPDARRGELAKVIFSAKEAVYKCQYPLTRTFLEFSHVEIELGETDFIARVLHPNVREALPRVLHGHHLTCGALVVTGITLRRQ